MYQVLQILAVFLVSVAVIPAVAHALEFPGKRRLMRDTYFAMQPIYYPGFTIAGGIGEVGGWSRHWFSCCSRRRQLRPFG